MIAIGRITTEYDEAEDRIRLSGEAQDGSVHLCWITRRLADRLLPRLFEILSPHDNSGYAEVIGGFAQQQAEAALTPSPPVGAGGPSRRAPPAPLLIASVDIGAGEETLRLTLRGASNDAAPLTLTLTHRELRQWLGIVRVAYRRAEWPMEGWPVWMEHESQAKPRTIN